MQGIAHPGKLVDQLFIGIQEDHKGVLLFFQVIAQVRGEVEGELIPQLPDVHGLQGLQLLVFPGEQVSGHRHPFVHQLEDPADHTGPRNHGGRVAQEVEDLAAAHKGFDLLFVGVFPDAAKECVTGNVKQGELKPPALGQLLFQKSHHPVRLPALHKIEVQVCKFGFRAAMFQFSDQLAVKGRFPNASHAIVVQHVGFLQPLLNLSKGVPELLPRLYAVHKNSFRLWAFQVIQDKFHLCSAPFLYGTWEQSLRVPCPIPRFVKTAGKHPGALSLQGRTPKGIPFARRIQLWQVSIALPLPITIASKDLSQ